MYYLCVVVPRAFRAYKGLQNSAKEYPDTYLFVENMIETTLDRPSKTYEQAVRDLRHAKYRAIFIVIVSTLILLYLIYNPFLFN